MLTFLRLVHEFITFESKPTNKRKVAGAHEILIHNIKMSDEKNSEIFILIQILVKGVLLIL